MSKSKLCLICGKMQKLHSEDLWKAHKDAYEVHRKQLKILKKVRKM